MKFIKKTYLFSGIIASTNIYGSCNRITFEAFINNKLVPELWAGACVVLDNSSIHKGEEIRAAIEAVGAKLVFLSPYSPEFNPIENLWSKLKTILRRLGARTYKYLESAIAKRRFTIATAYAQISLDNIRSGFAHCCYRTSPN